MAKIYEDAKDLHVRAVYVYKKASETKAYKDEGCTEQFTASELKDAYLKGAVINVSGALYKPVALTIAANAATVTYVTADSQTATTAKLATLTSQADA